MKQRLIVLTTLIFISFSVVDKTWCNQHIFLVDCTKEFSPIMILENEQDKRFQLNDIWVLESIGGKAITVGPSSDQINSPRLEIQVGEMKYLGNDGCNNYFGGIIELDEITIRFGVAAGTRKMCQNMEITDLFNNKLPLVSSYKIRETKLHLFDDQCNEILQLQKTD